MYANFSTTIKDQHRTTMYLTKYTYTVHKLIIFSNMYYTYKHTKSRTHAHTQIRYQNQYKNLLQK